MVACGFCRFVSITGLPSSLSVLVVFVVVVCQCFVARSRRGACGVAAVLVPCLPSVDVVYSVRVKFINGVVFVALWAVLRLLSVATVARSDLLPLFVNVSAVRRPGFGSSPFFVNFPPALGIGVSLTYFVNIGAAGDYHSPIYIKNKNTYIVNVGNGVTGYYKALSRSIKNNKPIKR